MLVNLANITEENWSLITSVLLIWMSLLLCWTLVY